MSSMLATITPKSDQKNADDFISGPVTIKITRVEVKPGTEQPVSVFFEGDEGKPVKFCKSMRRVLVQVWGADSSNYIGQSLTLYRDPKVTWAGAEVGGIRISHMSGITQPVTMALTESKAKRKPFTVRPLVTEQKPAEPKPKPETEIDASVFMKAIERVQQATTEAELDAAVEESRKLKGWPKATGQQMKLAIDAQREAIKQQTEERQPGE